MEENSKIEWTDHTVNLFSFMMFLVAVFTKCNSVAYIKSKFGVVGKMFNMVSIKVIV